MLADLAIEADDACEEEASRVPHEIFIVDAGVHVVCAHIGQMWPRDARSRPGTHGISHQILAVSGTLESYVGHCKVTFRFLRLIMFTDM